MNREGIGAGLRPDTCGGAGEPGGVLMTRLMSPAGWYRGLETSS